MEGTTTAMRYQAVIDDLTAKLLFTMLELELLQAIFKDERRMTQEQLSQLPYLINATSQERDEARNQLQFFAKHHRALPEKGKLLQAVIDAGPLLETLLVIGAPLPRWRNPPHVVAVPPLPRWHNPPLPQPLQTLLIADAKEDNTRKANKQAAKRVKRKTFL